MGPFHARRMCRARVRKRNICYISRYSTQLEGVCARGPGWVDGRWKEEGFHFCTLLTQENPMRDASHQGECSRTFGPQTSKRFKKPQFGRKGRIVGVATLRLCRWLSACEVVRTFFFSSSVWAVSLPPPPSPSVWTTSFCFLFRLDVEGCRRTYTPSNS